MQQFYYVSLCLLGMSSLQLAGAEAVMPLGLAVAPAPASANMAARRPTNEEWKASQAAAAKAAADAAADQAKRAAVDKVVSMLEHLQLQVVAEGEAEAATYNIFACFCKTTQKDKSESIQKGKSEKASLSADITKYSQQRDALDKKIANLVDDIANADKQMKQAKEKSDGELKVYQRSEADLRGALTSLTNAIKALKGSKSASLLQVQSIGQTVKQAMLLADALGLNTAGLQKTVGAFLQQGDPPVEMEDYKFHSGDIIKTLEALLNDFRKTKADVDAEESKRVQELDMFIQDRTDHVRAKTLAMQEAKKNRVQKIEDIATASQELSTVSATLIDDTEYMDELNTICSKKAQTWDQRTQLRTNELIAITQATHIIKSTVVEKTTSSTIRFAQDATVVHLADAVVNSDSAMELIEAEAESSENAPLAFLQKHSVQKHGPDAGRQMIISLLKSKGQQLKSTLLVSLATKIAADPFAKVKKLIQELIERLLTEATNEANQKGWCDKATADATQKRTYAADEIEDLNAKMAKLAALSDKLGEEIATLTKDINELNTAVADAEKTREEEKAENANTVSEAKAGLAAIRIAIDILDKFYKTSAKAKVVWGSEPWGKASASPAPAPSLPLGLSLAQGPLDDAPNAGFENGEAYQGAGAESGGIVGMMEVIASDFVRTLSETQKAEAAAEKQHLQFMTQSGKSLAEKNMANKEQTRLKDETDNNYNDADDTLDTQSQNLVTSIQELMELKATCVDTGMSYADRVAMRDQEIASLTKALCILGAYAEFGPDGLADAC